MCVMPCHVISIHVILVNFGRVTQEVVYDDPRFDDGQKKERARAKLQCLEDTRFGSDVE